jgi:hypothetical protein
MNSGAPNKMKENGSKRFGKIGYLLVFFIVGVSGLLMTWQGLKVWERSGFSFGKYSVSEAVASARFLVLVGGAGFLFGVFGAGWTLWLMSRKTRRQKR